MPLPLIVPIVLLGGGALAIALSSKKEKAPTVPPTPAETPPAQLTWEQTVNKQYQDAMASNDMDFVGRAANWMNTYGNRPDLYAAMKAHYDELYKAKAQQAAYTQATGGPPSSEELTKVYQTAMSADMKDPNQLQWAAALLRANGRTAQANDVQTKIQGLQLMTGQAQATPQGVIPTVPTAAPNATVVVSPPASQEPGGFAGTGTTQPTVATQVAQASVPQIQTAIQQAGQAAQGILTTLTGGTAPAATGPATPAQEIPTPIQTAETKAENDPNGTIALARQMLDVESKSGWKTALSTQIQIWQNKVGITGDGKFGPKSALQMAVEVGALPLIRYWAATGGTKEKQLADYRSKLIAFAKTLEANTATKPHGLALELSAAREQGQGYPTSPSAIPAGNLTDFANQVNAVIMRTTA